MRSHEKVFKALSPVPGVQLVSPGSLLSAWAGLWREGLIQPHREGKVALDLVGLQVFRAETTEPAKALKRRQLVYSGLTSWTCSGEGVG